MSAGTVTESRDRFCVRCAGMGSLEYLLPDGSIGADICPECDGTGDWQEWIEVEPDYNDDESQFSYPEDYGLWG